MVIVNLDLVNDVVLYEVVVLFEDFIFVDEV